MNGSDIIDALNNIDDWMIQDAKQHIRIAPVWLRWGSVAVCFCCICILGVFCIKNYLDFHLVEISPGAMTSVEEAHTNEFAASVDLPEDHGDTQEPLIWRYPDDYDLGDCAEYTADGTTLKWFDPVSNEVMEGGGFIWQLTAIPIDDFNSREKDAESESEDGWFDYITYNQYMFGKNENYVYVLSLPGDVQYNSQSETSYYFYTEIGIEVLDDIVLLNHMERNPSWYAPEMFPWVFSTLSSVQYPVSLTVPKEYEEHIIVDSTFYYDYNVSYGFEGEDLGSVEGDAIFSFYVDYNDNDQIHGLVWSITVEPRYDYDEKFDYGELADLNQVLNYTVLGSDDTCTYFLYHPGYPSADSYRNGSLSEAEIYRSYIQAGLAMLEGFISENGLVPEPHWLERYDKLTVQGVEEDIKSLKAKHTSGEYLDISDYPYTISNFVSQLTVDEDRNTNIALACEAIDGTLLEPGETFSFNDVVGECTAEKGYKEAFNFTTGDGERAMGGGISHVASTLYYTCLYADMEIMERHGLTYRSNEFPGGIDAEVEWGSKDLSFINTFDAPIYISASSSGSTVNIKLLTTEEPQFSVKVGMKCIETIPYETKYVDGTGVNQSGINGGTYTIVRYVYEDGNLIRTDTTEALDAMGGFGTTIYQPRNEVIYE